MESAPTPTAQPVAVKPAVVDAEIIPPAPPVAKTETPASAQVPTAGGLADDMVDKLEVILSSEGVEAQNKAIKYLQAKGKLRPLENLSSLKAEAAGFIIKNPKQFHKMVADWQRAK